MIHAFKFSSALAFLSQQEAFEQKTLFHIYSQDDLREHVLLAMQLPDPEQNLCLCASSC